MTILLKVTQNRQISRIRPLTLLVNSDFRNRLYLPGGQWISGSFAWLGSSRPRHSITQCSFPANVLWLLRVQHVMPGQSPAASRWPRTEGYKGVNWQPSKGLNYIYRQPRFWEIFNRRMTNWQSSVKREIYSGKRKRKKLSKSSKKTWR